MKVSDKEFESYLTTLLWSSTDDEGEPLDKHYEPKDICPEDIQKMRNECDRFSQENSQALEFLINNGHTMERIMHDFWLTRNRHGCGFWDGDYPVFGTELTEASHKFGELSPYIGDDGIIYIL